MHRFQSRSPSTDGLRLCSLLTQEEHHKKKTWEEESNEVIEKYGFVVLKDKE